MEEEGLKHGTGAAVAGIQALLDGSIPLLGTVVSNGVGAAYNKAVKYFKNEKKKAKTIYKFFEEIKFEPLDIEDTKMLVRIFGEIFLIHTLQFVNLCEDAEDAWHFVNKKLAVDVVHRIFNNLEKEESQNYVSKEDYLINCFINGKSSGDFLKSLKHTGSSRLIYRSAFWRLRHPWWG